MTPTDCSNAWNQSEPVHEQDENEERCKKPKCLLHQFPANNSLQEVIESFDEPFPKILSATWNSFGVAHRGLRKNDDASRHNPRHQH